MKPNTWYSYPENDPRHSKHYLVAGEKAILDCRFNAITPDENERWNAGETNVYPVTHFMLIPRNPNKGKNLNDDNNIEWNPVNGVRKLPKIGKQYLLASPFGVVTVATYKGNMRWIDFPSENDLFYKRENSYWAELPENPNNKHK